MGKHQSEGTKCCGKVKVESDDIGRQSMAQDILHKSTDYLRRIVARVGGVGGVTLSYVSSLSSLSARGLHLVGLVGARRWQQEAKEAMQVVVV